jgi:hypothetical protein
MGVKGRVGRIYVGLIYASCQLCLNGRLRGEQISYMRLVPERNNNVRGFK